MDFKISNSIGKRARNLMLMQAHLNAFFDGNENEIVLEKKLILRKYDRPSFFLGTINIHQQIQELEEKVSQETWEKLKGEWFICRR